MLLLNLTRWPSYLLLILAGVAAAILAFSTANLFTYAMANVGFIREFGIDAIRYGAALQMIELFIFGAIALVCWIIFKICEDILKDRYIIWANAQNNISNVKKKSPKKS